MSCATQFDCTDAPCLEANCIAELTACLAPTTSRPPPGDPPVSGSLPRELVGQWAEGGWSASADTVTFSADGQFTRLREVTFGVCHSTTQESGLAVADGTTLVLTFTQGHFVICNQVTDKTETYEETYSYTLESVPIDTWYPLGQKLHVIQQNCSACADLNLAKI